MKKLCLILVAALFLAAFFTGCGKKTAPAASSVDPKAPVAIVI
jgi:PBP1b-binding outer membrane lipoprotein LpoB